MAHNQGNPLEERQKYMVITPDESGKNLVKKLENVTEAIAFFKEQKGNSELAAGKDAAHKDTLASMEKDKINFVKKEFQWIFYALLPVLCTASCAGSISKNGGLQCAVFTIP